MCTRMNKEDFRSVVENALLRIARQAIRLECITESQLSQMKSQPSAQEAVAPRAEARQEETLDTSSLPANLRKAVDVFGGSIREVK